QAILTRDNLERLLATGNPPGQPMVLSCGHNFCRHCLAQLGPEASCPQCRAKVEPSSEESSGQRLCQEHKKPLQSFCSSEKTLLCPGCLEGHQGHPLLSLPQAAQQYKVGTNSLGFSIRHRGPPKSPERWEELPGSSERPTKELLAAEKQEVGLVLESLQQLLRERQPVWLGWLAEQEEKMEAEWGVALAQLSGKASRLQQLMAQTERKCRQPDAEFLQVGGGPSLASREEGRPATLARAAPISLFSSFRTSRTP
uniref:Uncharacterized protein n=1 Tax=Naja naja TaxID=35670 RepID=A0A8C6XM19_NAJNA